MFGNIIIASITLTWSISIIIRNEGTSTITKNDSSSVATSIIII